MAPGALPPPPDIVRSVFAELVVTDLARARWFWNPGASMKTSSRKR